MNYVEKINQLANERALAEHNEYLKRSSEFNKELRKVKSLSDRINKMWDIYQTCINRNIQIGGRRGDNGYEFETDGISHALGFATKTSGYWGFGGREIVGFGIKGGGSDYESVIIDRNGDPINSGAWYCFSFDRRTANPWEKRAITDKIYKILKNFDEFERKFYAAVESVIG